MPFAIGIDVGTTNTKAVLCELPTCDSLLVEKIASPKITTNSNTDYDVRSLCDGVYNLLKKCVLKLGAKSSDIQFVSIASVGESGVLIYPDGSFSSRSIYWYDNRGEVYARNAIESGFSETLYHITGVPTHSNSALFKILWMRDHGSDLKNATWLTMADFIAWTLCGCAGQDRTLASRTAAYDVENDCMSSEVLNHYRIPSTLFADIVDSGSPRGLVTREVQEKTGLPPTCNVCVSGHDHMSGAVACNLLQSGGALNSTGTSEGLLLLKDDADLSDSSMKRQITNGRFVDRDKFTSYASVPSAGLSFEWSLRTLGKDQDQFFNKGQEKIFREYLDGNFEKTKIVFVPHLRGSGPPDRDSDSRAFVYGMSDMASDDELLYATHLGVCLEFACLCNCMTNGKGLNKDIAVKVIGPAAKNPLWMQLKADVLNTKFLACDVTEAVARGSVIVSASKFGYEVTPRVPIREFAPDAGRHQMLQKFLERWYVPLSEAVRAFERNVEKEK